MKKSLAITIFAVMALIIIGVGAYAWTLDSQLESAAMSTSAYGGAAAGELAGALSELDEAMRESYYATDSALQSTLCAKAAANAASAVTALPVCPVLRKSWSCFRTISTARGTTPSIWPKRRPRAVV